MTKAQIKSRYRKTFAGFFWVVLNPIITFGVQAVIFKNILRFQLDHYYLFLLTGVIPWIFVSMSMQMTVNTFIANRQTLLAFKIDAWIFIISQIIDNFFNYILTYILLLTIFHYDILSHVLIFPLFFLSSFILIFFVYFLCFFLSMLNVFFRDTQFILQFIINLAYFITPIFYPESAISEKYRPLLLANPLYIAIKPFHLLLWDYNLPAYFEATIMQILIALTFAIISITFWRSKHDEIYLRI